MFSPLSPYLFLSLFFFSSLLLKRGSLSRASDEDENKEHKHNNRKDGDNDNNDDTNETDSDYEYDEDGNGELDMEEFSNMVNNLPGF